MAPVISKVYERIALGRAIRAARVEMTTPVMANSVSAPTGRMNDADGIAAQAEGRPLRYGLGCRIAGNRREIT